MNYEDKIRLLESPSFNAIQKIAIREIDHFSEFERKKFHNELLRGVALLDSHEQMCQYLYSFGNMHQAKLLDAYKNLPVKVLEKDLHIIDWGCGQGMGVVNLFDYLNLNRINYKIKKITLIEPSSQALNRAKIHVSPYLDDSTEIKTISKYFENITSDEINASTDVVIHIFSNILDVAQIDLKKLSILIDKSVTSENYFVCVGPLNPTNNRIDAFFKYFNEEVVEKLYEFQTFNFTPKNWTYKAKLFKLLATNNNLLPIEFYPPVEFHSAYELDIIRKNRNQIGSQYINQFYNFEVTAPFDLGASIYDDVHPILAVLNNIICRGQPTKTSIFLEESFQKAFNLTQKTITYGEIEFRPKSSLNWEIDFDLTRYFNEGDCQFSDDELVNLQLIFSPLAIARFQKVLVEALITGHLSLNETKWKFLVYEKDVPFAYLAINDFKNLFNNLTGLTQEYNNLKLPELDLFVIGNDKFSRSKIQIENVFDVNQNEIKNIEFDLVVSQSTSLYNSTNNQSFSQFKAKNNCYFNIYSVSQKSSNRIIYTSSVIKYKNLVNKTPQGDYVEMEDSRNNLEYFLQLFFRKESFRPGQLPILDRALQNLPVIGLLPTGGGKSLTYQISALLQPGVTMVIDPLKSLMKDQYDGLIRNGIDTVSYLNSSLTSLERARRENLLESSQLSIIFLSPERLSIASFRERLKNMHDFNVYFSFGVIDEVHCVSEWGHDFRFSYLHLGRNLYNYVRAKDKEITLFGLTATASFDVLADVERELSGNGAFELDADVIVRYENTNRLELQYKIEKVEAEFEVDNFYDKNKAIASHLPKALNITNHWPVFDSKSKYLKYYYKKIPKYLNELQSEKNIDIIKSRFSERQNDSLGTDFDLKLNFEENYFLKKDEYSNAGIIFCPHVESTGLSVARNYANLSSDGVIDIASFSGRDNDNSSMSNLESFQKNLNPIMVATKAFGMGIDKPNVRFTVNMNYSSSLESFVQEAGRAGRDKKIALSSILISDYKLAQISKNCSVTSFPVSILKNKWFKFDDLHEILDYYNVEIPTQDILIASPKNDIVKLFCSKDNRMFAFNECSEVCSEFKRCSLRKVNVESKGWKIQTELIQEIKAQNLKITTKNFQYLNADYQTVMYFFNEAFKGDIIEKKYMNQLLNTSNVYIGKGLSSNNLIEARGFLNSLLNSEINKDIIVFIPYNDDDVIDLSKAIYRMTCIQLIEDFTHDYRNKQFRIITKLKESGQYYEGLKRFLLRYYTIERADLELIKVKKQSINAENIDLISEEIYKCLAYLTEFVYDKISEKRKRAIDDMRNFCLEGVNETISWVDRNENLKDFIYYYFNSKYAKSDYVTETGEPYSLVQDTDGGKITETNIVFKYLRVIEDDLVGVGTPLDNIKHLHGAVKLISRSLTDSNPALYLLESYCLIYMGTKNNQNLEEQLVSRYTEGMIDFSNRFKEQYDFWEFFDFYNSKIESLSGSFDFKKLKSETVFIIHANKFRTIKNNFLEIYE